VPEPVKKIFTYSILLFSFNFCHAQMKGYFLQDSVKIGEPVKYSLSFSHPSDMELLLPDSNYNFSPFEFISKEYFPTRTINTVSIDSAVYHLRSFEIDKKIALSLPVFIISEEDSIYQYATADTVYLKELIPGEYKTLVLKENTSYNKVEKRYNYPYAIAIYGGSAIILLISFFFLGEPVKRRYRSFISRRTHLSFIRNYKRLEKEFVEFKNHSSIEQALSIWKTYLSKLEDKPINTYTTTEIISLFSKEDLKISLQTIDRAIYGGLVSDEAVKALKSLRKFSNKRYLKRKKEIGNV
jgi:hypothetical protein